MKQMDGTGEEILRGETCKILILMVLFDCREGLPWQNLEPQGLIGKILRNKELRCTVCQEPPPHGCGHDRTSRLWTARSDVTMREEKLWKSSGSAVTWEAAVRLGAASKTGNAGTGFLDPMKLLHAAGAGNVVEILELEPGLVLAYAFGF